MKRRQLSLLAATLACLCLCVHSASETPLGQLAEGRRGNVKADLGGIVPVLPAESARPIPPPIVTSPPTPAPESVDKDCVVSPDTMPTRSNGTAVCINGRFLKFDSAAPGRTLVTDDGGNKWYDPNPPPVQKLYVYVRYPFDTAANVSGAPSFNDTPPTPLDLRQLSEQLARRHEDMQKHLKEEIDRVGIANATSKEVTELVLKYSDKFKLPKDLLQFPDSLVGYDPTNLQSQLAGVAASVRKMDKLSDMLEALKREHQKSLVALRLQQSNTELNHLDAILRENEKLQSQLVTKAQVARKRHAMLVSQLKRLKDETPITKRQLDDMKAAYATARAEVQQRFHAEEQIRTEYKKLVKELAQYSEIAVKAYGSAHHEIQFGLDESSALQDMSESATKLLVKLDERTRVLRDRIIDLVPEARRDLLTANEAELAARQASKKNNSTVTMSIGQMKKRIDSLEKALVAAKLDNQDLILKQSLTESQLPLSDRNAPPISDREHPKLTVNASAANAYPEFKHSLRTQLLNYVDEETPPPRQKKLKKPLGKKMQVPLTKSRV